MALDGQGYISKEWLQLDGRIVPVWHICMQQSRHWWSAYVGVDTDSQVHAICDWARNYDAFNVLPRGISNRLTAGPSNADCLASGEPAGMGEGWSDIVANILRIRPGMTREQDMEMGHYVNGENIRMYPYSTNTVTNPQTFKYLDRAAYQEAHAIGEVWATMLYEVLWNIISDSGSSDDLFKHDLAKGNAIMLQILLDGMKLQPCNPSFIDAREAIVQAEHNLTGGRHKCAVWRGFAKRGLGIGASANTTAHSEDFGVPPECKGR